MSYRLVHDASESSYNVFSLEINAMPERIAAPIDLYVTADRADYEAIRISKLLPNAEVRLTTMARIKAIYKAGERIKLFDYREFYSNLTDEQYASTKIQDSRTAEMV